MANSQWLRAHSSWPNYPPLMTLRPRAKPPSLGITGLVEHELVITTDDLAAVPGIIADLGAKAEGFSGEAAPLNVLLDRAQPTNQATHGTVLSDDGHYKASIPLGDLTDKAGWLFASTASISQGTRAVRCASSSPRDGRCAGTSRGRSKSDSPPVPSQTASLPTPNTESK